jgi:hypothetical protein
MLQGCHCMSVVELSQPEHSSVAMQHLQRCALKPHPDLAGSAHAGGRHSFQALRAADVISRQLQHAAQRSTRTSFCPSPLKENQTSVPWQRCSLHSLQHSSPVQGSSTGRPVPSSCSALGKRHGSQSHMRYSCACLLDSGMWFWSVSLCRRPSDAVEGRPWFRLACRMCGCSSRVQGLRDTSLSGHNVLSPAG